MDCVRPLLGDMGRDGLGNSRADPEELILKRRLTYILSLSEDQQEDGRRGKRR